jgi:hypothetical protein
VTTRVESNRSRVSRVWYACACARARARARRPETAIDYSTTGFVTMHAIQVGLFLRKLPHNSLTFPCHSNNIGPSETISVLYDLRLATLIYIGEN